MTDVTQNSPATKPARNMHKADAASTLDIRDPDSFQETVLGGWQWVEKNLALVSGVLVVGILILLGFVAKAAWQGREERKAQDAYYAVETKFNKLKEGFDRAKMRALMPAFKDQKAVDVASSGDLAKDYGTVLVELDQLARKYAGTVAGAQASILSAETYLNYGKTDKAVEIAQIGVNGVAPTSLLGALVRVQLGSALAAKGDCKEAIKTWNQVLENKSASYLYADVDLRSGLCFEQINEPLKAIEMYQKVSADAGPQSSLGTTAKGLLRALELKTPKTVPGTAAQAPAAKNG